MPSGIIRQIISQPRLIEPVLGQDIDGSNFSGHLYSGDCLAAVGDDVLPGHIGARV